MLKKNWNRRHFLKVASTAAATVSISNTSLAAPTPSVLLLVDPADDLATSAPRQVGDQPARTGT